MIVLGVIIALAVNYLATVACCEFMGMPVLSEREWKLREPFV